MANERVVLDGIAASPGVVLAPLWMVRSIKNAAYQPKGSPEHEALVLRQAINAAYEQLREIAKSADAASSSILEFQLAMLTDNTFYELARHRIGLGDDAYAAWNTVLSQECASYQNATHVTFQARAIDLEDIQTRVARALLDDHPTEMPYGNIICADNLTPSAFITHNWKNGGIALSHGSTASHVAVLARQFNVPMVVNLQKNLACTASGKPALLQVGNDSGKLIVSPSLSDEQASSLALRHAAINVRPLQTATGLPVSLMINLAHLSELQNLDANSVDGIGLVRTEFLFAEHFKNGNQPGEQCQFETYCKILKWAGSKPVFVRTMDVGGDKQFAGFVNHAFQSKLRGIRLSLTNPEVFSMQIRALLRSSAVAPLHVTLPMVSSEADFFETLMLFENEAAKLAKLNIAHKMPNIGIMVEVPAVAMTLRRFAKATHFAIGTNDLLQYTLAEPRDASGRKSGIDHPAIMALINDIVAIGAEFERPVSVCGDAASDAKAVPYLLDAGVTRFSVNPPSNAMIARAIETHLAPRVD